MNIVKAEGLTYEYMKTIEEDNNTEKEKYPALKDVSISIKKGEFVAILGQNGSGKSTFAKHINALLKPDKGTMWVNGYDTEKDELVWDIRQSAGMVFQNPDNQIVAAIVEEDIAFGPENMGIEPSEIRKRVDGALETVGMSTYKRHSPSKLSGGQKQRIAIAGVLAMKPECIVLDEPTAMLDPIGRKEVMDTIISLNNEGITIVLITHYMEEAVSADRVIVINDGNVAMEGTPREIFSNVERIKKMGLDVPQVTDVIHKLRKMGLKSLPQDVMTIDEMVGAICQYKLTI